MLRMIDRHAVRAVLAAGRTTAEAGKQFGISPRTVQRIAREGELPQSLQWWCLRIFLHHMNPAGVLQPVGGEMGKCTITSTGSVSRTAACCGRRGATRDEHVLPVESTDNEAARRARGVGLASGAGASAGTAHSAVALGRRRAGRVAGAGTPGRLRTVGGVPLPVVFDRPKTVVIGKDGSRPIWNATLAQTAIDFGFTIELCAPRSLEQKGSVENLVGFVKASFFRSRRFENVGEDLLAQPS